MLKGVCCFHSETGTEGGHWAFQDSRYIRKNVPMPYCKKCGKYLDPHTSKTLRAVKAVLVQEIQKGKGPPECPDGDHERAIGDSWSYKGLHILEDGDLLTIFSPEDPRQVVWSGTISLRWHRLFSEHASGLWIHADQEGIDRKTWATYFFKEYPAALIPARKR